MVRGPRLMDHTTRRTPSISLERIFLRAVAGLPEDDGRGAVVAEALGYLQQGFDAHYASASGDVTDDEVLVGDNAYAWAVETIARLDEPEFVAVASRMIRDGAGAISEKKEVTLDLWTPHLSDLLRIISGDDAATSEERIRAVARKVADERGS